MKSARGESRAQWHPPKSVNPQLRKRGSILRAPRKHHAKWPIESLHRAARNVRQGFILKEPIHIRRKIRVVHARQRHAQLSSNPATHESHRPRRADVNHIRLQRTHRPQQPSRRRQDKFQISISRQLDRRPRHNIVQHRQRPHRKSRTRENVQVAIVHNRPIRDVVQKPRDPVHIPERVGKKGDAQPPRAVRIGLPFPRNHATR